MGIVPSSGAWDLEVLDCWGKRVMETGMGCSHTAQVANGECWEASIKNEDPKATVGGVQV